MALGIMYLVALHEEGFNNPTRLASDSDKVTFHYYYVLKDLYGIW